MLPGNEHKEGKPRETEEEQQQQQQQGQGQRQRQQPQLRQKLSKESKTQPKEGEASSSDSDEEGPKPERKYRVCCSYRLLISLGGFVAFFNATFIRIGVVIALVCMTKPHDKNYTSAADDGCPPLVAHDRGTHEFDWSSELRGLILSGAFYGFLVGPFVSGFLSFRFGGKIVLVVGMFCAGVSHAVIPELTRISPYFFFGVRIVSGFFGGFLFPASYDVLSHWVIPEERQVLIGGALIGVPLCTVMNYPVNGFLCTKLGWVWIFYFSTVWLGVWAILFQVFVFDYPSGCPYVSRDEYDYIVPKVPPDIRGLKVPWKQILRSLPVYAYIVTHFCINYGLITIILSLPSFMKDVHHFDMRSNSLLSASPYVGSLVSRIILTFTFDRIRKRLNVTKNALRKIHVGIGLAVPSGMLIAVSVIPCKYRYASIACFVVFTTVLELSISGGYLMSLLDMCPSYNNILTGIANAIANLAGLLSALAAGFFTPNGTHEEWNVVFYMAIGFFLIAGLTYILFGSNDLQPWGLAQPANKPPVNMSMYSLQ